LRDSSGEPLIAAGLLNGNISATNAAREISDFHEENTHKTTSDPSDALRLS
jgi:hypothetical protein